jgi:hypothetical protein
LTLYEGGDKDAQPSAYLKSKLDAQLYKFGTQPHFCIAYVIGCKKLKAMGDQIKITAIEIIYQEGRTLMQIDLWYEDQNKGSRVFIDTNDFFKMLSGKA